MKNLVTSLVLFLFFTLLCFPVPSATLSYPNNNAVVKKQKLEITYVINDAQNLNLICNFSVDGLLKDNKTFTPSSSQHLIKFEFDPLVYKNYSVVLDCDYTLGSFTTLGNIIVENHTTDEILFLVAFHVGLLVLGVAGFLMFGKKDFLYILAWLLFFLGIASVLNLVNLIKEILQYLNYEISYRQLLDNFYASLYFLYYSLIIIALVHLSYILYLIYKILTQKEENWKGREY